MKGEELRFLPFFYGHGWLGRKLLLRFLHFRHPWRSYAAAQDAQEWRFQVKKIPIRVLANFITTLLE